MAQLTRRFVDGPLLQAVGNRDVVSLADSPVDGSILLNMGGVTGLANAADWYAHPLAQAASVWRAGWRWQDIGSYATGKLTFPQSYDDFIDACVLYDKTAFLTGSYWSPFAAQYVFTLAADVKQGDTVLSIVEPLTGVTFLSRDRVNRNVTGSSRFITAKSGYSGIPFTADTTAGTLTMVSAADAGLAVGAVVIPAGQTVVVNRQRWDGIRPGDTWDSPNVLAFRDEYMVPYVQRAVDRGARVVGGVWNELTWSNDRNTWTPRFADSYADLPDDSDQADNGNALLVRGFLELDPPQGAVWASQTPDKTASNSYLIDTALTPILTDAKVRRMPVESRHRYPVDSPVGRLADVRTVVAAGGKYETLMTSDDSKNFQKHLLAAATRRAAGQPTPQIWQTETGYATTPDSGGPNDQLQARFTMANLLGSWMNGTKPGLFTLNTDGNYTLTLPDGTMRLAGAAVVRLMTAVGKLGVGYAAATAVPTVVGYQWDETTRPLATQMCGGKGAALWLWRSPQVTTPNVKDAARPSPRPVPVSIPPGATLAEVTVLSTGATASYTTAGNIITVQVDDDPVMVRVHI